MLEGAMKMLEQLMEKMDVLANYWLTMDATLERIHSTVEELRNYQLLQSKAEDLRRDWNGVGRDYLEYKNEVRTTISLSIRY